jgi:hypothetical protein
MNREMGRYASDQNYAVVGDPLVTDKRGPRLRVLLLADAASPIGAVRDHIDAIASHSRHLIVVVNPVKLRDAFTIDQAEYDAILIHYSICILFDYFLPAPIADLIRTFPGPKIQIIQDECRWVDRMTHAMANLGIGAVFSSLSLENLPRVYHHRHLRDVKFYSSLPGYISKRHQQFPRPPIAARSRHLVYRGQRLAPWYGKGAKEKYEIGEQALRMAEKYDLVADIKTREEDRIFGGAWSGHLTSGKAALGTEGGVSVFDFDETIEKSSTKYQAENPGASWDDVWERFVRPHEGNIVHRTITPRTFEAIMCGTALVMYPGDFRGVLRPWDHYIPLDRDGSNEAKVAELLHDDKYLQELADRAYRHVVENPALQFTTYVAAVDGALDELWELRRESSTTLAYQEAGRSGEKSATLAWLDRRFEEFKKQLPGVAHLFDPDARLQNLIQNLPPTPARGKRKRDSDALNVLIITDFLANHIGTVRDHLAAFANFSRNRVSFVDCRTCPYLHIDLSDFDCIVLHYSVVISSSDYLPKSFAEKLRKFQG